MNKGQGVQRRGNAQNSALKLDKELVLTVHGSEHEDILLTISEILSRFKGTFLSNHFHRVGLQFTGMMRIAINHMYLKPFISCLDSLTSYSVRFDTQILNLEQSQKINEQIRFEFEVWGYEKSDFRLKFLQWLSRHRLIVESIQDSIKRDSEGNLQQTSHITVATEYVVNEQELQDEISELSADTDVTIVMLDQEMLQTAQLEEFKEAI